MGRKRKRKEPRQSKCIYCGKSIRVNPNGRLKPHRLAERACLGSGWLASQMETQLTLILANIPTSNTTNGSKQP